MPSFAEELTPPLVPTNVTMNMSQTRIHLRWDSEIEGDSIEVVPDPTDYLEEDASEFTNHGATLTYTPTQDDLTNRLGTAFETIYGNDPNAETDDEVAFFQVEVATDSDFTKIVRHDRHVKGHSKTWRYNKPSSPTFYGRVRSVDALGNKSEWVTADDFNKFPYQPCPPNVTFKEQDNGNYRANVNYQNDQTLSPMLDEDIVKFQFAAREVEWTRIDEPLDTTETTITVQEYSTTEVPLNFPFTIFIGDEQMSVTSITGAENKQWHVTRAVNGTTAHIHATGVRLYYFGRGTNAMIQMVAVDEQATNSATSAAWRGLEPGTRWKFRVRAIDAQNRKSFWSAYTSSLKASKGARYDNGNCVGGTGNTGDPSTDPPPEDPVDPGGGDDGEDDPTVDVSNWPHERIIRFEADVSEGFETSAVTGFNCIATSARVTVDTAPTLVASTVDVNLNGVSFLTVTIPAADPKNQSDLTWVTPPLRIGSQEGQLIVDTDLITVTETAMQDAIGTLTVYLMVYLV